MKKILFCIIIAQVFVACKPKQKEVSSEIETPKIINQDTLSSDQKLGSEKLSDSEKAKQWLVKSVENYFVTDLTKMDSVMNSICTKTYYTYKNDATGVEMDGGMTKKGFEKKWKTQFKTQFGGSGVGFLISGQDWTIIKVSKCVLSNKKADEGYLFETIISDKGVFDYKREIKVIKSGNRFLIADVLEYE